MNPPAAAGASAGPVSVAGSVTELWETLASRAGERFAGLMATQRPEGLVLSAHLAGTGGITTHETVLPPGASSYPALTPGQGAAFWYEREIHDLFGIVPAGHPRLEPLILPLHDDQQPRPRPGTPGPEPAGIWPDEHSVPRHVMGAGMFTIPHGPVRSGVMESIEYLVETPGEDIPHLNMRVFYKHRGIEKRFEGMPAAGGVLLAERTEGVASVAHALAYCHAIEQIAGARIPWPAALVRVLHAELERIASHLDAATRLTDAAGLAVATARFGTHKERVMRLVSHMCGSRFGRGVVVPGGVSALPGVSGADFLAQIGRLEKAVTADARVLMGTASFLDRLRRTGPLRPERAREHGALGPVGKASGFSDDARLARPYDAYPALGPGDPGRHGGGDALARLRVRWDEVSQSFHLLRQAAGELADAGEGPLRAECDVADGRATGWAEAPQGEVLYDVRVQDGHLTRCRPRSASFHNLVLFHEVFAGDILTDFPFIEASFGLSIAGVAL
ncbi:MAG TPA: NADH-quinone oxidoreductase subunit C [Streptosporangiaceae bacterium]|nr:NADH-quinone oxidoreductase subunit C [Streptosporangiaceae bacterium]